MRTIGLALLSLVVGCASSATDDQCPAADYQSLVGKNIAAVTLPAALFHRVIGPETAVTEDYRLDRMNIYHDADGVISKVDCG